MLDHVKPHHPVPDSPKLKRLRDSLDSDRHDYMIWFFKRVVVRLSVCSETVLEVLFYTHLNMEKTHWQIAGAAALHHLILSLSESAVRNGPRRFREGCFDGVLVV